MRRAKGFEPNTSATVSARGQITIPKAVREALGLTPGQRVVFLLKGGHAAMVPLRPLDEMRGFVPRASSEGIREEEDEERG